jgi:hypothetical protein
MFRARAASKAIVAKRISCLAELSKNPVAAKLICPDTNKVELSEINSSHRLSFRAKSMMVMRPREATLRTNSLLQCTTKKASANNR